MRHAATWMGALAMLVATAAHAATVQVTVLARDGKPLSNAVVVVEPVVPGARPKAGAPVRAVVRQERSQFQPIVTLVPAGSTVRFTNQDPYDHHVRVLPASASLLGESRPADGHELRLPPPEPGKPEPAADVQMSRAGPYRLGCHLHSTMRGFIYVTDTPWVAQTGEDGVVTIADVPEGPSRVLVWHPDQIVDATPVTVDVRAVAAINVPTTIQPRRRR